MSHLGVNSTLNRLSEHYWFPCMLEQVVEHIKSCDVCQQTKLKSGGTMGLLEPIDMAGFLELTLLCTF